VEDEEEGPGTARAELRQGVNRPSSEGEFQSMTPVRVTHGGR
jgi:hypothetical protein